jgi:hypothetical protein
MSPFDAHDSISPPLNVDEALLISAVEVDLEELLRNPDEESRRLTSNNMINKGFL